MLHDEFVAECLKEEVGGGGRVNRPSMTINP